MKVVNYTERERAAIPLIEKLMCKQIPELPESSRRRAQATEQAQETQAALLAVLKKLGQASPGELLPLMNAQASSTWSVQRITANLNSLKDQGLLTSYRRGAYFNGDTVFVYQGSPDGAEQ